MDPPALAADETLAFLDSADREGLVVEPQNTQDPLFICCCGVLTTAKRLPNPASFFATNYRVAVDATACNSRMVCETRCQMEAIACDDGPAAVKLERCIGCGLCVTTCPTGALRIAAKPAAQVPPKDIPRLYTRMYRERYGALGLAAAVGRDRSRCRRTAKCRQCATGDRSSTRRSGCRTPASSGRLPSPPS